MRYKKIEEKIDYEFKNKELLKEALTHKSYAYESGGKITYDNEKFEFLGDSVLNLVISDIIYKKNPEYSEGKLSKFRASLINEYTLTQIAKHLKLGKYLLLGKGEEQTGGRDKASLLSNAYEAILAAVYLDSGFRSVYRIIKQHFTDAVFTLAPSKWDRDYKSQMQEMSHKLYKANPRYKVVLKSGPDHQQVFNVELTINKNVISTGSGNSKKDAEQQAAKMALETLKGRVAQSI